MNRKAIITGTLSLLFAVLVFLILLPEIFAPALKKKLQEVIREKVKGYNIDISGLDLSIINRSIVLHKIQIQPTGAEPKRAIQGEINSIQFQGIHIFKALFNKEVDIRKIGISDPHFQGSFREDSTPKSPALAGMNIHIGSLEINGLSLSLTDTSSSKSLSIEKGQLKVEDLNIVKQDTLSLKLIRNFQFTINKFHKTTRDSLYTFSVQGMHYEKSLNQLTIDSLSSHPNYTDYAFTNRHPYEVDRIQGTSRDLRFYDLAIDEFIHSKKIACSYVELAQLDLRIFRDKRKPNRHRSKPLLQELIRKYPGVLQIDSLKLLDGNISYKEHVDKAVEAGYITFNKIVASINQISNDTLKLNQHSTMDVNFDALLMGKGKINLYLNIKLMDPASTFAFGGHLYGLDLMALNPMLEKNAFTYATSGKIESVHFKFLADKEKARGQMLLKYQDLQLAVKDKQKDDTVGLKSKLITFIVNKQVLDANPLPGEDFRVGIIDYDRNPENFIFTYCFKATFSGIKSTVLKKPTKKKGILQKIFRKPNVM